MKARVMKATPPIIDSLLLPELVFELRLPISVLDPTRLLQTIRQHKVGFSGNAGGNVV